MTNLTIRRTSSYPDPEGRYTLLLDGEYVASLLPQEEVNLEVSHGPHFLEARFESFKAKPAIFIIQENETSTFELSSGLKGSRLPLGMFVKLLAWKTYLVIQQVA